MLRCWSRVGPARLVFSLIAVLAALTSVGPPVLAVPAAATAPGLSAWLTATGAHAVQAAAPDDDLAAGGRKAVNRSLQPGLAGLRPGGPPRLRRVSLDVGDQRGLQAAYDLGASEPLLRTHAQGERLWRGEHLTRDPAGQTGGDLALTYRPPVLDQDLTLAVSGQLENHWLQDYRRFGIGTSVRSDRFELGTTLFDDVPGSASAQGDAPDRRLDGYGIAVGARLPELPWAWVRVRRQWQIPIDGEQVAVSDRLSLQLGPFAPLEVETGTTGDGDHRSWFAQLRFKIELGGD
jgi:hypothetical protein